MTEPKSTRNDLPEDEAPAYDEPPATPADPLFEDNDAPEAPEIETAPALPEDAATAPAPALAEPAPEPEPEPVVDAAPAAEPGLAVEPEPEPEPHMPEEMAAEAADQALDDPHHDIFGPEPWDQAAPTPAPAPAPDPEPEPVAPAWRDIGPAREEAPALKRASEPMPGAATAIGAPPAGADATLEVKRSAFAVYLLYLSALVVVGIPLPVGAWLAYDRRKDAPAWLRSHYTYQIRTFWITMAGLALAALVLFLPFALFPLTIVALVVWLVVRCFFGMVRLHRGEPIFNPQTWIV